MKERNEDVERALKSIIDHFSAEDRSVRDRQIRRWRELKFRWDGFSKIWFDEVAHDWRIQGEDTSDQEYYDKPINVARAYLESIIAALSVTIPPIKCFPDDADNPLDVATAKAGDRIAELVYKHNDVSLLWIHALYIYCTEGLVACYNYTKESEEYGTYEMNETDETEIEGYFCPHCDKQTPDDLVLAEDGSQKIIDCPECGEQIEEPQNRETRLVDRITGKTEHPKSRQILECYGGLYVKVPNYVKTQRDCPYLIFSEEYNYAQVIENYPDLGDLDIHWQTKTGHDPGGSYDPYERWGRLNTQYRNEFPINTVTVRKVWLRPSAYNVLDSDQEEMVRKEFPSGVMITLANEEIATCPVEEKLDDHWTLTKNPLSDYLHHDPLGFLLTNVQDITDEIISLTLQTIEHGIPQTFADPNVLNFAQYGKTEVAPGTIYPAKPKSGKTIRDSFYEIKTATLSGEVLPFERLVQELGQVASGAMPSIFGGEGQGSKTAAEYSMSKAQSLQRLHTPWKMLTIWWKTAFSKVIPAYIANVGDDQRHVIEDPNSKGNFINVYVRKAELQGKLGNIECVADEQLPSTWTQMREVFLQLMDSPNPTVVNAMMSPENLPYFSQLLGLNQFKIPGEADRQKQYEEIADLLNSEPILQEVQGPNGEKIEGEGPSVPVDPDVDNHLIQFQTVQAWAVSDAGRLSKVENPDGYRNVIIHGKMHQMLVQPAVQPTEGVQSNA